MSDRRRVLMTLAIGCLLGSPGAAVNFTVDDTADRIDLNPGSDGCLTTAGTCTLRAAIEEANVLAGPDTITLPAGLYKLTIPGDNEHAAATGDLDITQELEIVGAGAGLSIVDGNGLDRVFDVIGVPVTITGVTVRGGRADDATDSFGGGIRVGGSLDLTSSEVVDNFAQRGGGIEVHPAGTLTVVDCLISGNEAADLGFTNAQGGGIYSEGETDIEGTTVTGNRVYQSGGGIVAGLNSLLSITNSTVADNEKDGVSSHRSDVDIVNATIVGNASRGLIFFSNDGTHSLSVKNTILAGNGTDCLLTGVTPTALDFAGEHNLDSDLTCPLDGSAGDLPGFAAQLGALLDNGGTGPTHVPLVGSPVIDNGNSSTCPAGDQRGAPRFLDGDGLPGTDCDIGAVEVLPCVTAPAHGELKNQSISIAATATSCFSTTLGPALTISGSLVVKARDLFVLKDGVTVLNGGFLALERDPAAGSGIVLP